MTKSKSSEKGGFFQRYWKWGLLLLALIVLSSAASFLPLKDWIKSFTDWVQGLGALGVVIFIVAYAIATVLFLPGALFTLAAGLVYGVLGGAAVALTGATIGASLAFLCGRYLVRKRVEEGTKDNEKFQAIDGAIEKQGWKIIGLLRLSPLIPFNLSNYFYGVTAIKFWPYFLATFFGMMPGTLLYAYLGAAGKAGIGGAASGGNSTLKWVFFGVGLLATVVVTVIVSRTAKKALKDKGAASGKTKKK
ncbi:MAG: TVP38/TMEM64 family protein [Chthoniobacterales bacterium]